jgi:tetratricopeptide (TPR) repeat protein
MQRKTFALWSTLIILVTCMIFSFNLACSKKNEDTKPKSNQALQQEESKTTGTKNEQAQKHFNQALMYEEQKMPEDALKEYLEAVKLDPQFADAHFRLGALYHTLNAYASALEEYNKVLKIDPKYRGIHTAIAHAYYVRGMHAWVKAMNMDQLAYAEADTLRLLPYHDNAELNRLIDGYQNTLRKDTTDAAIFSKLSQALYILAVEEYQKGIQASPSDTAALLYLALTYSEQGYPQKAMKTYDALQKVDPRTAGILMTMLQQKEKEKLYYDELRKRRK